MGFNKGPTKGISRASPERQRARRLQTFLKLKKEREKEDQKLRDKYVTKT